MTQMHIAVRFLAGRYHGVEWPPAPATLFQALIAGGRTGASAKDWTQEDEAALNWLESLHPPVIMTIRANKAKRYDLFVPDNESDIAAKDALGGSRFDLSKFRTRKVVSPRTTNGPNADPDVVYTWSVSDPAELDRHLPAIRKLAYRLYALGWGIDMACADTEAAMQPASRFADVFQPVPAGTGAPLRVPQPGFSGDVLRSWTAFRNRITDQGVDPYTKADSYAVQDYRRATELPNRAFAAFKLETAEGEGFSWPWPDAPVVAAWLRHAAAEALREEAFDECRIAGEVLGHAEGNGGPRMSYVPVPTVGHQFSDGAVRRALLVESFDMDGTLAELLQLKLASRALTEAGTGRWRARLAEIPVRDSVLAHYIREADIWSSVTPVILHGHNSSHGKLSQTKTERLLIQAFVESGYPECLIRELAFRPACSWTGPGAAPSMRVPRHLAKWPRYHVWIRFADLVRGPVLAGIGRHYGLGLFAAGTGRRM